MAEKIPYSDFYRTDELTTNCGEPYGTGKTRLFLKFPYIFPNCAHKKAAEVFRRPFLAP